MNQTLNKRTFLKTSIAGLVGLLGVNLAAAPKKKFGHAKVGDIFINKDKKVFYGQSLKLVGVEEHTEKYLIQEANDEEGWFVAHAQRVDGKSVHLECPIKFTGQNFHLVHVDGLDISGAERGYWASAGLI